MYKLYYNILENEAKNSFPQKIDSDTNSTRRQSMEHFEKKFK